MSGVYTCNSCGLQFPSGGDQREHMKTDWHRYNLKRRVANLPAITEQTFKSKQSDVASSSEDAKGKSKQLSKKEQRMKEKEALLEKKRKLLEIARERMIQQQLAGEVPTLDKLIIAEEEATASAIAEVAAESKASSNSNTDDATKPDVEQEEEVDEEKQAELLMQEKLKNRVDIPLEQCLFCTNNKTFKSFEMNLTHMYQSHGFYMPEQKYLINKEGLVKYMSEKVGLGNVCIVCNYQGNSLNAVRSHMLSKRHCKIPYESNDEKLEISEFYDFEKSYATTEGDNGEWEDIDEEDVNSDDEEIDETTEYLYQDGIELHLPSGIKVGHRSMQRYYKQDLRPEKILTEGQGTIIAAETRQDFITNGLPDRTTVQAQQRAWQTEVKDKKTHSKRAAKFINNQPHYRDQLLQ
ncbi:hypothetical protein Kpol_1035p27 [Vanderwaltozyma polyspora DSM 70294]|uniref:C2H2-type domain-containing protein n=1 Tax=Vanderwaltozyma polyspora (strain ATCC 22028 / DSM 70294 / BCRC 21397 / CBS 2163 / NBRC 10782 / NRRL Y-8283 / UCD 57-17) TaxID=436907 RepID=A7TKJ2_VANPO|nr:uncharacterized protein Kpol_1035p27 [Vanderwaltozyma polyspora DSM 70294]EDO17214.1 hypothetical protein Kpol_1035p27 [Vanderwaltozyma polyspora DSM 70294]